MLLLEPAAGDGVGVAVEVQSFAVFDDDVASPGVVTVVLEEVSRGCVEPFINTSVLVQSLLVAVVDDDVASPCTIAAVLEVVSGGWVEPGVVLLLWPAAGDGVGVAVEVEVSAVVDDDVGSPDVVGAVLEEMSGGWVEGDVGTSVLLLVSAAGDGVGIALEVVALAVVDDDVGSPGVVSTVLEEDSGGWVEVVAGTSVLPLLSAAWDGVSVVVRPRVEVESFAVVDNSDDVASPGVVAAVLEAVSGG